ncbi:MAG: ATPase AAA [Leptospiraceae bacterium]|nr:MAG: ATPase AAA [Leptospiraceae bacterium]
MDLFSSNLPLTELLRPKTWNDFIGNENVLNKIKFLPLHSMILYGPPGCGKTSIARLIIKNSNLKFYEFSATNCGIKEIRNVIDSSQNQTILLFLDEIHRFNKTQQDSLLPYVEENKIILIGATTEHPGFSIIPALLSRCQIYKLEPLSNKNLEQLLNRCIQFLKKNQIEITFQKEAKQYLIESSYGDARKLIRYLELALNDYKQKPAPITIDKLQSLIEDNPRLYDKNKELHYDYISAFIKSLRGSDPDAALLYLATMLEGGEDPLFIARRMIIFASEDIGNASPLALNLAVSTYLAVERIGMPEARIILSQCAIFLATSPKSNASYLAINNAMNFVKNKVISVPNHLRNPVSSLHKKEGAGKEYKYPHNYPEHFIKENYFPRDIFQQFYFPTSNGTEIKIKEKLKQLFPERKYE